MFHLFLFSWNLCCMPICTMFVSWRWPLLLDRWPSIRVTSLAVTSGRQSDIVEEDASGAHLEAWYILTLVLALLKKLFTSIRNFDQLGVVLCRKRPNVLILGILYFCCKLYYFGNSKRKLIIVLFYSWWVLRYIYYFKRKKRYSYFHWDFC